MSVPLADEDALFAALGALAAEDLSGPDVAAAKICLMDAIAVACASRGLPVGDVVRNVVDQGPGSCSIIASPGGFTPVDAAFANGVLVHAALLDDFGAGGFCEGTHPSSYVVPAALAVGEWRHRSGLDLLHSVVLGYEAADQIGALIPEGVLQRGFSSVPLVGVFGAVGAASYLLADGNWDFPSAVSLAADLAGGLAHGRVEGSMEMALQSGFAARNGVLAALLVARGADITAGGLSGPGGLVAALGFDVAAGRGPEDPSTERVRAIRRVKHKRFALNGMHEQTCQLIADSLAERPGWRPAAITGVTIQRPGRGPNRISEAFASNPPYQSLGHAQMSARFAVAAALLEKPLDTVGWLREHYRDDDIASLAARCDLVTRADDAVVVDVTLSNGESVLMQQHGSVPRGNHSIVEQRFDALTEPVLGERAHRVRDLVRNLEHVEDVTQLTVLLRNEG